MVPSRFTRSRMGASEMTRRRDSVEVSPRQMLWMGAACSLFGILSLMFGSAESLGQIVHGRFGHGLPLGAIACAMLVAGVSLFVMAAIVAWRARPDPDAAPAPAVDPPRPAELPRATVVRHEVDGTDPSSASR